jgi:hypothetical protein
VDNESLLDLTDSDFAGNVPADVWFDPGGSTAEIADVGASATCDGAAAACN